MHEDGKTDTSSVIPNSEFRDALNSPDSPDKWGMVKHQYHHR